MLPDPPVPLKEVHIFLLKFLVELLMVVVTMYLDKFIFLRVRQDICKVTHMEILRVVIFVLRQIVSHRVESQIFRVHFRIEQQRTIVVNQAMGDCFICLIHRAAVWAS